MLLFVPHVAAAPRAGVGTVRSRRSRAVNLEGRFGKGLRSFLRQIVPDAARDHPVRICARELLGIRTACGHAPGVSAVSMACRVAEVKANIHPVPSPFRVMGHHRLVVSLLATRVWRSLGNGSCPAAAGRAAARFLLRVHPGVRPHELDGHIRKENSQRLAIRGALVIC